MLAPGYSPLRGLLIGAVALALVPAYSHAAPALFVITLDTAGLIGHPAGPFSIDLQLIDGNGTGDGNSVAGLTNFAFGGGAPAGTPTAFGDVSGSLNDAVTMTDSSFFNEFIGGFTPGEFLRFQLSLTTSADSGGIPDQFSLAILDRTGFEIPTFGPGNALLTIDIAGPDVTIRTFGTDLAVLPNAGGNGIGLSPPTVEAGVPEQGTAPMLFLGMVVLALSSRSPNRCARM